MTDTTSALFQSQFEQHVPELLQIAHSYVQGDERVSDIWLYATYEDNVTVINAAYRIDGQIVGLSKMPKAHPEFGRAKDTMKALANENRHIFDGAKGELPNSMQVHYRVSSEEMKADFSYERIDLGKDEPYAERAVRWADELEG